MFLLVSFVIGILVSGLSMMCCTKDRRDKASMACKAVVSISKAKTLDAIYGARPLQINPTGKNNVYEVSFYYNCSLYKIPLVIKRGPKMIPSIQDKNGHDITEKIMPYLGPNLDFYGMNITPELLGYFDGLIVDGSVVEMNERVISMV